MSEMEDDGDGEIYVDSEFTQEVDGTVVVSVE